MIRLTGGADVGRWWREEVYVWAGGGCEEKGSGVVSREKGEEERGESTSKKSGSRLVFGNTEASGGVKYNGLSILAEGNAVL